MILEYTKQLLRAAKFIQVDLENMGFVQNNVNYAAIDSFVAKPIVEMDEDDLAFTQDLLKTWKKRLRILQEKQAACGFDCPPQILIEMSDIEKTIKELSQRLETSQKMDL